MATWRFNWTLSLSVDDEQLKRLDREDIIDAVREKLDDLESYCQLIGINIDNKAVHDTNPDMAMDSIL